MQAIKRVILGLTLCGWLVPSGAAAEPNAPAIAAAGTNAITAPAVAAVEPALAHSKTAIPAAAIDEFSNSKAGLEPQDIKEREAITAFYAARKNEPLWVTPDGLTERAKAAAAEIENADAWGLDPQAFNLPLTNAAASSLSADDVAKAELSFSSAVLLYARHARGGRIMEPAEQLNSHIDRKPKLINPKIILEKIAEAAEPDAYLRDLHNQHAQFIKLRQGYLAVRQTPKGMAKLARSGADLKPGDSNSEVAALRYRLGVRNIFPGRASPQDEVYDEKVKAAVIAFQQNNGITSADGIITAETRTALLQAPNIESKRIVANMEQWRWMWENMGDMYLWANVPDFQIRIFKSGEMVHSEKIVAGEIGKQTSIFSRPLKSISLRPLWRVPESIKVREIWPSLMRGGGLMTKYGLRMETKDGLPVNWRSIDWPNADIRKYEVVQPPGRGSALGNVKFNFPSQHTIYMHDTPDKWMFKSAQRTLSHGCLRLRNPMQVAEIVLKEDRGWEPDYIAELVKSGPLNNEVAMTKEIPMHITYQTVIADETGKLVAFRDVYGHERRITQALDGDWNKIVKGHDHLAPVLLSSAPSKQRSTPANRSRNNGSVGDMLSEALGSLF